METVGQAYKRLAAMAAMRVRLDEAEAEAEADRDRECKPLTMRAARARLDRSDRSDRSERPAGAGPGVRRVIVVGGCRSEVCGDDALVRRVEQRLAARGNKPEVGRGERIKVLW